MTSMANATRVLLVEDNPGDAELTTERLVEATLGSFEVERVATLRDTVERLSKRRTDAIILDLDLPDSKGMTTISQVLQVAGLAPVVVVSGTVDERLRLAVSHAGADDVYTKDEANSRLFPRSLLHVIERRRARERQTQIEALLDSTPDAILVVTDGGVVRYVNQAALTLFRRPREEFLGGQLGFPVREGEPVELRVSEDGTPKICEMRVVGTRWQGEAAFAAVIRDVSQKKTMEAQLLMSDRLVSMGTLAAGVAHEINNPLASVAANVTIALDELGAIGDPPPGMTEVLDGLRDARDAAEQIRQIVRDLKVYSRADDERQQTYDVHRMLDSVARMALHELRHHARLVKDYGGPLTVVGNEPRMSQVFLNLLVNAAQAIPPGSAEGNEIRIRTSQGEDGRVQIDISDTGTGIPLDVQRRMFTPFVTTKPVGTGTGLGLAICQRIVAAAGGEIDFTTELGKGTCFTVRLPSAAPTSVREPIAEPTDATVIPPQRRVATPVVARRGRVLAVDDDPMILHSLRRILGRSHDVECEERATTALARLEAGERFDVILCDMMMPEMTGIAFCTALEALDAAQAQRLVFVTGGVFTPEAQEFLANMRHRQLDKPFDLAVLRALVNGFVQ